MGRIFKSLAALAVLSGLAVTAHAAPITADLPVTCLPSGGCTRATVVVNPDGTNIAGGSGGGGSVPTGSAGSPNAAVVTVQGIAGATPIPVSGSFTATNPSVGTTGSTAPTSATYMGVLSGGNLVGWNGAITNSAFGATQSGTWTTGRTWALASGTDAVTATLGAGSATIGAISNTAFGATQSGTWNITNITGTVSLPTGAATSALQTQISGQLPATLGAKTTANSLAVNLASDQTVPVSSTTLATSALQTTGNTSLGTLAGTVGTVGSAAPTTAQQAGGKNAAGNVVALLTDTAGRLQPSQAIATSTQVTTVASTSTTLIAANTGRLLWEVQIETALTAPLYLCFSGQTCSATVHDRMIASGTNAGVLYTSPFGFQGAVTYYTTQASVTLNQTAWAVQ